MAGGGNVERSACLAGATYLNNMAASPPQETALMAKLVKRVEEFGKSPKVKDLEKKMLCEAEGPKTRAKISSGVDSDEVVAAVSLGRVDAVTGPGYWP
jgi:hypothetical protein